MGDDLSAMWMKFSLSEEECVEWEASKRDGLPSSTSVYQNFVSTMVSSSMIGRLVPRKLICGIRRTLLNLAYG